MYGVADLTDEYSEKRHPNIYLIKSGVESPIYDSRFTSWYGKSTVRSSPRRLTLEDEDGEYFSPSLIGILKHKIIQDSSEEVRRNITIHQLYRYLDFTTKLENVVVNKIAMRLANGYINFGLPREMIFDAFKIYCDEGYHALFSHDMMCQVESISDVAMLPSTGHPYFMRRLYKLQSEYADSGTRELLELFFVIISETLISGLLLALPRDKLVKKSIRELVMDHAIDEGKHHSYFAQLLKFIWHKLSPASQDIVATNLPELILAFLSPDQESVRVELASYAIKRDDIEQIIAETYTESVVSDYIYSSVQKLVSYLREVGVFEKAKVQDAFCARGIIRNEDLKDLT